jgi:hypothetical protein
MASADESVVLDALKRITESKKPKSVSKLPPAGRPLVRESWQTNELLNKLNSKKPVSATPKVKTYIASNEIKGLARDASAPNVLKSLLVPIQIIDTPRRAIISGVRELADILDSDSSTKASFGDFIGQTRDVNYGFGTAFPMKGWGGRILGFIGDVALDPLTYATLGGTVAAKSVVTLSARELAKLTPETLSRLAIKETLADGSVKVATRSLLGRTVAGREGRQKLASFARTRMQNLVDDGAQEVANLSKNQIDEIVRDVAARGKTALPQYLAKDMGVRGPGVYYFGSRVKVPGSDVLGGITEKVVTDARLALSRSKALRPVRVAATPKGVGAIDRFGPNKIRDFRVALAEGSLTPEEARTAMTIVDADDYKRLSAVKNVEQVSTNISPVIDRTSSTTTPMHVLLENDIVANPSIVVDPADVPKANEVRAMLDDLQKQVNDRSVEVGGQPIGYQKNYFPRMESEATARARLKDGDEAVDQMLGKGVNTSGRQNVFQSRELGEGDTWFGHVLKESDLNIQTLNNLARNAVGDAQSVAYDIFETDFNLVMTKYIRAWSEQMAFYDMVEYITKRSPDLLIRSETIASISPTWAKSRLVDAPSEALNAMQIALRNHVKSMQTGMASVNDALEQLHGSLFDALNVMRAGSMDAADLEEFRTAIGILVRDIEKLEADYLTKFRQVDSLLENKDGVSNFQLIANQREAISKVFESLKARAKDIQTYTPQQLSDYYKELNNYLYRVGMFERTLDNMNDIHNILPTIGSHKELGAGTLYDVFAKAVDSIPGKQLVQRVFADGWTPSNPSKYSWKPQLKALVSQMTDEKALTTLSRVASGEVVDEKDLDAVAYFLFARIVENEKLVSPGSTGASNFLDDFGKGIKKKAKTVIEDTEIASSGFTKYSQWVDALNSLRSGNAYPLQDMLIQEQAFATYIKWDELLRPQGVVLGDDVIDEIIQRTVRPYLVEATKIGDTKRIAQLTSNNFGRSSDTGPLGLYRRVARERGIQGDLFDEIESLNQISRTMTNELEQTTQFKSQYKSLSAEKKNAYNKFRQRKFRIIKDFQESLRKTKSEFNTKQVAYLKIDEQLAGLEEVAFDRFQSIVNGGGSLETLKSFVETYRYKFMNTDIDVLDVDYILEQIDTLSSFFSGTELNRNLKNMFAEQFTRTRSRVLLARDIELQDILQEMVYMSRTIEESYGFLRILPDNYFASPLGSTDATDVLLKNQNVTRSVVPDVVPTSKEFQEVQAIYDALKTNDVYPLHKSVENYANLLYILADLDLDKVVIRTQSGSQIEVTKDFWLSIINGKNIDSGMQSSGRLGQLIKSIKDNAELYAPEEFATYGDELTDDLLLKKFVEYTLRNQSDAGASAADVAARRINIQKEFNKSSSGKFLGKMRGYEERMLAEVHARKSAQKTLDMLSHSVDSSAKMIDNIASDVAEWTPENSAELMGIRRSLVEAATSVRNVPEQEVVEDAIDFVGDVENLQSILSRELPLPQLERGQVNALERGARSRAQVEDLIKQPLEQKSVLQLQEEIKMFEMLKDAKTYNIVDGERVRTPLIDPFSKSFTKLIRERQARLRALAPELDQPVTAEMRQESATALGRVRGSREVARTEEGLSAAARRAIDPQNEIPDYWDPLFTVLKPVFDKSPTVGMDVVPLELAATSTEMGDDVLRIIGDQLANIARQPEILAKKELDDTRGLLDNLQAAYDQASAVGQVVDAEAVNKTLDNLSAVSALVQGANLDATMNRGTVLEYSAGSGEMFNRHQEAMKFFEDAKNVLDEMGAKKEWEAIDSVVKAQIDSEIEFWRTVSSMSDVEVERQMLLGVQRMIDGGGTLLPNGKVRLANGQVVDGVPEEAVMTAGQSIKRIKDSTIMYQQLGQYYPNLYASPEMKAMFDAASRISDPAFVRKMAYYIGPYTKFFKAFAVLSPGFHVRNGLANAVQLVLADADIDNMIGGSKLYFNWIKAKRAGVLWEDFVKTLPPDLSRVAGIAREGALGGGGGIYTEVFKDAVGANKLIDNWLTRKNYAIGQASDNYSRFVLAFDSAMKGADAGSAQARVKRFFFDYEDLSSLDKVMKQIIPFWTFYSKNLTLQITNMWLNPKPYLIYNSFKRNFEDSETPLPPFVKTMGGFRIPFGTGLYAMPDFGFTRIPQELDDLTNPMRMLNKVTPALSIPIEQIIGKDVFTEKEFTGTQDRLLNALRGAVPSAGQADRLLLNDNPMSQLNAWLSYLGSPIRKYN